MKVFWKSSSWLRRGEWDSKGNISPKGKNWKYQFLSTNSLENIQFLTKKTWFGEEKNVFYSDNQELCFFWNKMFFLEIFFEKIQKHFWQIFYGRKSFGNFEKKNSKKYLKKTFFLNKTKFLFIGVTNPPRKFFCQKLSVC